MPTVIKSYIGVGKCHVRPYNTRQARRFLGNVSQLNLAQEVETLRERDYTRLGGGTAKRIDRIIQVNANMTWHNFNGENLALALGASITDVPSGSVTTAEEHPAFRGAVVRLVHPPTNIDAVTNTAGTTTYALGTDYELSAAGIFIPDTSTIPSATGPSFANNIKVTYDYDAYQRVEAATQAYTEIELLFEGLNEAESGKAVVMDLWRMALPPASELALIGEGLATMDFAAELLKDPLRTANQSPFFRAQFVV
jgi:hypothetical protein